MDDCSASALVFRNTKTIIHFEMQGLLNRIHKCGGSQITILQSRPPHKIQSFFVENDCTHN